MLRRCLPSRSQKASDKNGFVLSSPASEAAMRSPSRQSPASPQDEPAVNPSRSPRPRRGSRRRRRSSAAPRPCGAGSGCRPPPRPGKPPRASRRRRRPRPPATPPVKSGRTLQPPAWRPGRQAVAQARRKRRCARDQHPGGRRAGRRSTQATGRSARQFPAGRAFAELLDESRLYRVASSSVAGRSSSGNALIDVPVRNAEASRRAALPGSKLVSFICCLSS